MARNASQLSGLEDFGSRLVSEFRGLDLKDPAMWPLLPRIALHILVAVGVAALLAFVWLRGTGEDFLAARSREQALRAQFQEKISGAVNLDLLKRQYGALERDVTEIQKQLPSTSNLDALLSDINQAGLVRGLQFEFVRPGSVTLADHYAELPSALRVTGSFDSLAQFASDIAALPRIVTLDNLRLTRSREGNLSLETTAKTYRYLSPEERAVQSKAGQAPKPGAQRAVP